MYSKQHYRRRGIINALISKFWSAVTLGITLVVLYVVVRVIVNWWREMNTVIAG